MSPVFPVTSPVFSVRSPVFPGEIPVFQMTEFVVKISVIGFLMCPS